MNTNLDNTPDKYKSWEDEPDEWLVEVLQSGDPVEAQVARQMLRQRYDRKLRILILRKISPGHEEDVLREIWLAFFSIVRREKIRKGVSNLLLTLMRNKRADEVRRIRRERNIEENHVSLDWDESKAETTVASLHDPIEDQLEKRVQKQTLRQIPYRTNLFSPCERVFWILREQLDYPLPLIARITAKKPNVIFSALYNAREKVKKFVASHDFDFFETDQDLRDDIWPEQRETKLVVESFSNCVVPQLTPDELKPLGLSVEAFQKRYAASIMLPRYDPEDIEIGLPYLVLTQRRDWDEMRTMFKRLSRRRGLKKLDFLSPEQCLLKLDQADENVIVTPDQVFEFLPEPDHWVEIEHLSEHTYLAVHSPFMRIRVSFGFFAQDLITSEVRRRWPFLPEDAGL